MKWDSTYPGIVRLIVTVVAVAMVLYHVWAIAYGSPEAVWYRGTHLSFALALLFLLHRRSGEITDTPHVLDYVLLVLAVAPIFYLFVNYEYVVNRIFYVDELTWADMIMGTLMTVMVLEATRRVIGWALPITALVFLRAGRGRALAIGLIAGNRNIGLMLAATGFAVPDVAWLYFALAQFPIYLLPHLLKPLARRLQQSG